MQTGDIVIIGGGAAGMMAAAAAKESDKDLKVIVLEKMPRPGRKILITGKGRCNLTNATGWEEFSRHIHPKPNCLKHSFKAFNSDDTIAFFSSCGLKCVTERGSRVFPESMKATDVVDTLVKKLKADGVVIECNSRVTSVLKNEDGSFCTRTENGTYVSTAVIIATGGLSYPTTGSEGDGYMLAKGLGHKVTECFPSLTAITPRDYDFSRKYLEGIHLKNVAITLYVDGNAAQEEFGELDFTNGGIEGALGFRISRKAVKALRNGARISVSIDLKPGIPESDLRSKPDSSISTMLPAQILKAFKATNAEIIRRVGAVMAMKDWRFEITGNVGYERAVVTAGGVSTDEINIKTMGSKIVEGLFFAGEVTDMDGDTGGYNLQIAWSTGTAAGRSAASYAGTKKG